MALGTLTLDAKRYNGPSDSVYWDEVTLVGDASYPTGGTTGLEAALQALTKDQREILCVFPIGLCGGFVPRWDKANKKLIILTSNGAAPAAMAEFTNAGNNSGTTYKLGILSR